MTLKGFTVWVNIVRMTEVKVKMKGWVKIVRVTLKGFAVRVSIIRVTLKGFTARVKNREGD